MAENLSDILTAALGALDEGIAVLDGEARVLLWNRAAAAISGYQSAEMLAKPLPAEAYEIDAHHLEVNRLQESGVGGLTAQGGLAVQGDRPVLVNIRHRQGHSLPAMLHRTALRDALGKRFGTLLRFHPVEEIDTLPHGETEGCDDPMLNHLEESQAGLEDRLDEAMREWSSNGVPFGVLWVRVDQAALLRKTHGRDASEAMLKIVEQTLLHGLRASEMMGRWGTNEYLVLSHERSAALLAAHGQHLAVLAQRADFRWWGDRVPLTVSIGAAQAGQTTAGPAQTLAVLLKRAQMAMETSHAGGGCGDSASADRDRLDQGEVRAGKDLGAGGQACSQS